MTLSFLLVGLFLGPASAEFLWSSVSAPKQDCHSCIDNVCYATTIFSYHGVYLRTMPGIPAFDLNENILYFTSLESSYSITIPKDMTDYPDKQTVPRIPYFATGSTVDQKTRELYVWMQHSDNTGHIYPDYLKNCSFKYNPITKKTTEVYATDEAIKEMHFKERLHFTLKFRKGLFTYDQFSTLPIPAFSEYNISQFVIDRLESIYATTESGVYRLIKDGDTVTLLIAKNYSVSVDSSENIYFMDPVDKTVYKLDYTLDQIIEAGKFGHEAKERFIFDKYNKILVKAGDVAPSGDIPWILLVPKGQCKIGVNQKAEKTFFKVSDNNSPTKKTETCIDIMLFLLAYYT